MLIKQTAKMTESERIAAENSNNQYLQALSYVAVGTIFPFAGKEAPTTFMFCDGRELDKTEYSELFEAIGYTFGGSGDVFKLPDLRGKTLFGYDSNADHFKTLGKTGGTKEIAIQDSNLPEHNFFGSDSDSGIERGKVAYSSDGRYTFLGKESATNAAESNLLYIQGKGKKIETLPPYLVSNFIIKVMQGTAACEYDYAKAINTAVKQNFDEAVAAGTIKGEKGDSGVYVGTEEPTDPDVMVWVNPDGIADDIPSGGSGTDGADGKDGFSPTVEVTENESGHTVSITDANGTKSFDVLNGKDGEQGPQGEQGLQGEQGADGSDGANGKDGVSVTHSWDGTVLTITSASGTSSAELKGEKGEPGETPLEEMYSNTITANLCDEIFEYGYLTKTGDNHDTLSPIETTFRTKNYISVEGGQKLHLNNSVGNSGAVQMVQYDINKVCIVERADVSPCSNKWDKKSKGILLDENTKYIRFTMYRQIDDLSTFSLNLFYEEDIEQFFSGAGDVYNHIPRYLKESVGKFVNLNKIQSPLTGKKIIYDGDSIAESRLSYANNGGGYAKLIADTVGGVYENYAVGGARLTTAGENEIYHSIVDNIKNLPNDGDLYCFEGGINDYWSPKKLGTFDKTDFTGELDTNTVCGALESIFRYALANFVGKPICFVIVHKVQSTAYSKNSNGDTFEDYRNAMVGICNKYSIPYYDAFNDSGLNGWNTTQSDLYLTANTDATGDGTHPNELGYKLYYVSQLITLFERTMPR